jgi:hypothetical protein
MVSAAYYRERADALRKLARAASDRDEALALNLRAVEFDYLAEQADTGQVQQRGTEAPPPPSVQGRQDQPAQQQQQVQPKDPDPSES